MFRFRARTKRDFFTSIVSTRFVAKSACVFQPVVLFDLEKTEGENTPVSGASVREESETIFVLSGVLLRVVVQNTRDEPLWLRPSAIELDCRPPPTSSGVQCTLEQGWADGWSTRTVAGDGSLRYIAGSHLEDPREADSCELT